MRVFRVVLLALLLIVVVDPLLAQNPILGPTTEPGQDSDARSDSEPPTTIRDGTTGLFSGRASLAIRRWSNTLQRRIADLSRRVRAEGDLGAAATAFLFAVLFGAIHIAGPGHGKVFALSYFSSHDARPADGIAYSAVVNTIDSLSALFVVLLGYVVLTAIAPGFRTAAPQVLEIVSYSIIVLFGIGHLLSHLFGHHHHQTDGHKHNHHETHRAARPWMLAVSVGLIPCPVSTILLVYGVVNGVLGLMILMVIGVSVGGFITMTVISLVVIAGRRGLLTRLSTGAAGTVSTVLEFLSSGLIIAVGMLLLLAAIL